MIQIEILNQAPESVLAAFYYEVPIDLQLPAAVDKSRVPSGSRLGEAEIDMLRLGTLIEKVSTVKLPINSSIQTIQTALVAAWTRGQGPALAEYTKAYGPITQAYIDGRWQ